MVPAWSVAKLINRGNHRPQRAFQCGKRLRVTEKEIAVRTEIVHQLLYGSFPGGKIEIDQNVAAENQIEFAGQGIRGVIQIQAREGNYRPNLRPSLDLAGVVTQ